MKVEFENTDVWGFESAIRGMRNPKNSWGKSDSYYEPANFCDHAFVIGDNDMRLAKTLIGAGTEHAKFMRMIHVQTDLTLPRGIWQELDTYHFGTKNSCSTMHKLLDNKKPITEKMFDFGEEDDICIAYIINYLEVLRHDYQTESNPEVKNRILYRAKMLLPEGFLQMRTWDTNYAELRNIYFQRRNHRMPHWRVICNWIEGLPYSELITYEKGNKNE